MEIWLYKELSVLPSIRQKVLLHFFNHLPKKHKKRMFVVRLHVRIHETNECSYIELVWNRQNVWCQMLSQ